MIIKNKKIIIEIDNLLIIVLISFLLSAKIKLFLTSYFVCYSFIIFHESAHMLVAALFGKKIKKIRLSLAGASIILEEAKLNKFKELMILFAGPISNICLALLFRKFEFVYEINIFLSILNMNPIYPLDGYNILCILLNKQYVEIIQLLFLTILIIISFLIFIVTKNPSLLIFSFYIIVIKYGAKSSLNG